MGKQRLHPGYEVARLAHQLTVPTRLSAQDLVSPLPQ